MEKENSVLNKHKRIHTLPQKFIDLQRIIQENGTDTQKLRINLTEHYIAGLNNMFDGRDVDTFMLKEFDFPMFLKELHHDGLLEGKTRIEIMMLIMDVRHIVRHTWEFTDKDGKTKNGDDLYNAKAMWENDKTFSPEELVRDIQTM